eukprot:CAMPEP_0202871020 /NCGR_PEP_ID=MMETSP1391-20130828/17519_1 /ASSEMBLY_ACC=CAM_ASM_000867 /TAXON_ID=1034604 /ORGANISM="Chlamydomonas leiostraca, Strain SAG 11-49" /LENGTH=915 /DNA_ID=CAMNT_0049551725 /DNA_START=262 /DNA_END=3010 /DNA_ORIENTATION=+
MDAQPAAQRSGMHTPQAMAAHGTAFGAGPSHVMRSVGLRALQGKCAAIDQDTELGAAPMPAAVLLDAADLQSSQQDTPPSRRQIINRKIKAAGNLLELHAVVAAEGPVSFDIANTSHALSRLAKLHSSYSQQLRRAGLLTPAAEAAAREDWVGPCLAVLSPLLMDHLEQAEAWDVAMSLYAYALMDHYDRSVFDALCSRACVLAPSFKPVDCANIMYAFGRFGHYHPELLRAIPQVLLYHMYDAKPGELSQVLWGYGRLRVPGAPGKVFLEAMCDTLHHSMAAFRPQELANTMWALARLGHHPGRAVLQRSESLMLARLGPAPERRRSDDSEEQAEHGGSSNGVPYANGVHSEAAQEAGSDAPQLNGSTQHSLDHLLGAGSAQVVASHTSEAASSSRAQQQRPPMQRMVPQDVSNMLWAYGRMRYKAAALLDTLPLHLGRWLHAWSVSDLCCLLVGYTHARHYHRGVLDAVAPLLASRAHELTLSELVVPFWAYGIFQHKPPTCPGFLDTLTSVLVERLRGARPQTYSMLAKACANLRYTPDVLLHQMALGAARRVGEMRPDEMAALLYGMSHLAAQAVRNQQARDAGMSDSSSAGSYASALFNTAGDLSAAPVAMTVGASISAPGVALPAQPVGSGSILGPASSQLFHAVVRQCIRILEEPGHPYADARHMHHKVLNSIVFSCVRVGYTPWTLIDFAESKGIRIIQPHAAYAMLQTRRAAAAAARSSGLAGAGSTGAAGSPTPARTTLPGQAEEAEEEGHGRQQSRPGRQRGRRRGPRSTDSSGSSRFAQLQSELAASSQQGGEQQHLNGWSGSQQESLPIRAPRPLLWPEAREQELNGAAVNGVEPDMLEAEQLVRPRPVPLPLPSSNGVHTNGAAVQLDAAPDAKAGLRGVSFGRKAPPMLHVNPDGSSSTL